MQRATTDLNYTRDLLSPEQRIELIKQRRDLHKRLNSLNVIRAKDIVAIKKIHNATHRQIAQEYYKGTFNYTMVTHIMKWFNKLLPGKEVLFHE